LHTFAYQLADQFLINGTYCVSPHLLGTAFPEGFDSSIYSRLFHNNYFIDPSTQFSANQKAPKVGISQVGDFHHSSKNSIDAAGPAESAAFGV
jgi:hypothetical protein